MGNNIISKELLSEVLEKEVEVRGCLDKFKPTDLQYIEDMVNVEIINIYELAHKCKEWARRKGFLLSSCPNEIYCQYEGNKDDYNIYTCYINISQHENGIDYDKEFTCETESEAIFKACQWIYENTKDTKNGNS